MVSTCCSQLVGPGVLLCVTPSFYIAGVILLCGWVLRCRWGSSSIRLLITGDVLSIHAGLGCAWSSFESACIFMCCILWLGSPLCFCSL